MDRTPQRGFDQRPVRPRKIRLDCDVYRPHSVRESEGDARCDHDFDTAPTLTQDKFATWNCTKCGRAFKFEAWNN
jgi:hypothetical protein